MSSFKKLKFEKASKQQPENSVRKQEKSENWKRIMEKLLDGTIGTIASTMAGAQQNEGRQLCVGVLEYQHIASNLYTLCYIYPPLPFVKNTLDRLEILHYTTNIVQKNSKEILSLSHQKTTSKISAPSFFYFYFFKFCNLFG